MKKAISIILIVVLAFGMYGCSGSSELSKAKKLIKSSFKKTDALDDIHILITEKTSTSNADYDNTTVTDTELLAHSVHDIKKYEMSCEATTTVGEEKQTTETYYKDKYYYTDEYYGKFKTKLDVSKLTENENSYIEKYDVDDMKTIEYNSNYKDSTSSGAKGEKCKSISFSLKDGKTKEEIVNYFEETDASISADDVTINKSSGKYVVNAEGYLVMGETTLSVTFNNDGEERNVTINKSISYDSPGKKVNPYNPEDSEYTELKSLEGVSILSGAMAQSIAGVDHDISMEMDLQAQQGKVDIGYTRDFVRKLVTNKKQYFQETNTKYKKKDGSSITSKSGQYYTDGIYYNFSDSYDQKIYSRLSFGEFYGNVYNSSKTSPADLCSPAIMKDVESKTSKNGETTVTFGYNDKSSVGRSWASSLMAPLYGIITAEGSNVKTVVNNFKGTAYVNKKGYYTRTEITFDIVFKFKAGDLHLKGTQTVKVNNPGKDIKCTFPKFKGYKRMSASELLGGYNQSEGTASQSDVA